MAFVLALSGWGEAVLAGVAAAGTYAIYFHTNYVTVDGPTTVVVIILAWPLAMTALFVLLQASTGEITKHERVGVISIGFALAGSAFGFPGFVGTSLLLLVWILPPLYILMMAMSLLLLAMAARPYLPMGTDWRKPAIACISAMVLALMVPMMLWFLYILTVGEARVIAMTRAGASAIALIGYLKRRRGLRQKAGARH